MTTQLERINWFLQQPRMAFVGLSRDPKSFSRMLYKQLEQDGKELLIVNRLADNIDGHPAFKSISALTPVPECAFVLVGKDQVPGAVEECALAGVKMVWLFGVTGEKEVSPEAVNIAKEKSLPLITGYCPFMFLDSAPTFHKIHRWIWKVIGFYPK